jgi:DNA polymerase elongation subunit (family B)
MEHPFAHRRERIKWNKKDDIIFQITNLFGQDEVVGSNKGNDVLEYKVHIFGVTKLGISIHSIVDDFYPSYYIQPPKIFKPSHLSIFKDFVMENLSWKYKDELINIQIVQKTSYMGYQEPKLYLKLYFKSYRAFKGSLYLFLDSKSVTNEEMHKEEYFKVQKKICIPGINEKKRAYKLYESNIDPILRFIHFTNVKPCGWCKIESSYKLPSKYLNIGKTGKMGNAENAENADIKYEGFIFNNSDGYVLSKTPDSRTQVEIMTGVYNINPFESDDIAPISVLSFDLECTSSDGGFPQAKRKEDKIIQCGMTMYLLGKPEENEKTPFKYIATLKDCCPIEGAIVESFNTESELISRMSKVIQELDPDVITGFNIFGFDFKYWDDRAKLNGLANQLQMGRLKSIPSVLVKKELSSSAMNDNIMYFFDMKGRIIIDLLKVIKREHNLISYKLDTVAEKWLGLKKHDVSPKDIFRMYAEGTPESVGKVAEYCIQDCLLVNKLMDKLCVMINNFSMANVCSVPLDFLFMRGQGIKGHSLVSQYCQQIGYIIPHLLSARYKSLEQMTEEEKDDLKKFKGAIVIDANTGAYFRPVAVNDYSSLYPSSIISNNLSPDTLITNESPAISETEYKDIKWEEEDGTKFHYKFKKYAEIPDKYKNENMPNVGDRILCEQFDGKNDEKNDEKNDGGNDQGNNEKYKIITEEDVTKWKKEVLKWQEERPGRGIIPTISILLLKNRKIFKKKKDEAAERGDTFMKVIYDGMQLAYKITGNSIYGLMGAPTSAISCKPVAASTTATGRELLIMARDIALEMFPGTKTVYGDSVTGDTPILCRLNGNIQYFQIDELPLDRSMLSAACLTMWEKEYHGNKEIADPLIGLEVWSDTGFTKIKKVIRHKTNKQLYEIITKSGYVTVTEDHSLLDSKGNKVSPKNLKIGDKLLTAPFPRNECYYNKNRDEFVTIAHEFMYGTENAINAEVIPKYITDKYIMELMNSGVNDKRAFMSILNYNNNFQSYHDIYNDKIIRKDTEFPDIKKAQYKYLSDSYLSSDSHCIIPDGTILKIRVIDSLSNQFVYDLETENHHFAAGVGNLIVHNTDSIMMSYPLKNYDPTKKYITPEDKAMLIEQAMDCAKKVECEVSSRLPWPHNLCYEKVYFPFFLYSKKRYSGILYDTNPNKAAYVDNKGIVLKRRDNAGIVKKIFKGALDILLYQHDVPKSIEYVQTEVKNLLNGKCVIEDLIITKTYKKPKKTIPAHTMLAYRQEKRDPGNAFSLSDRVPYVYIELSKEQKNRIIATTYQNCSKEQIGFFNGDFKCKESKKIIKRTDVLQGDKIETPAYIKENNLKPDYYFYFTNQITKPLIDLYKAFLTDPEKELFEKIEAEYIRKKNGGVDIRDFFTKK